MIGAEHFRAAERLADQANNATWTGGDPAAGAALAAEAQVHATLALVMATLDVEYNLSIGAEQEWREVRS